MLTFLKRPLCELLHRSGSLAALRLLRTRILRRPVLIILCYHRVTGEAPAFSPACVRPGEFARQIAHFGRWFDIWPLARVADYLAGRAALRRDTLVLTFDDGYLDNHACAAAFLEERRMPATFFVTTGPMRQGGGFWWDDLGRAFEDGAGALSEARRTAGEAAHARVRAYRRTRPGRRPRAAAAILCELKWAGEEERARLLAEMGTGPSEAGPRQVMTEEQVADLARRGFEIGAHGVSHAALSTLGQARLQEEVRGSLDDLRRIGLEPSSFAYPYGDAGPAGGAVEGAVAAAGTRLAVTTDERAVHPSGHPLRLPRKVLSAQTVSQIACRLERLAWTR